MLIFRVVRLQIDGNDARQIAVCSTGQAAPCSRNQYPERRALWLRQMAGNTARSTRLVQLHHVRSLNPRSFFYVQAQITLVITFFTWNAQDERIIRRSCPSVCMFCLKSCPNCFNFNFICVLVRISLWPVMSLLTCLVWNVREALLERWSMTKNVHFIEIRNFCHILNCGAHLQYNYICR